MFSLNYILLTTVGSICIIAEIKKFEISELNQSQLLAILVYLQYLEIYASFFKIYRLQLRVLYYQHFILFASLLYEISKLQTQRL